MLQHAKDGDIIMWMGDNMKARLGSNMRGVSGEHCVEDEPNEAGRLFAKVLNEHDMCAVSTMRAPRQHRGRLSRGQYACATYRAPRGKRERGRQTIRRPAQLDYVCVSRRWATSVRNCQPKWGPSLDRWGKTRYDHAAVCATFAAKFQCPQRLAVRPNYACMGRDELATARLDVQLATELGREATTAERERLAEAEAAQGAVAETAAETLAQRVQRLQNTVPWVREREAKTEIERMVGYTDGGARANAMKVLEGGWGWTKLDSATQLKARVESWGVMQTDPNEWDFVGADREINNTGELQAYVEMMLHTLYVDEEYRRGLAVLVCYDLQLMADVAQSKITLKSCAPLCRLSRFLHRKAESENGIRYGHVKGHSGARWNERADQLATWGVELVHVDQGVFGGHVYVRSEAGCMAHHTR